MKINLPLLTVRLVGKDPPSDSQLRTLNSKRKGCAAPSVAARISRAPALAWLGRALPLSGVRPGLPARVLQKRLVLVTDEFD